MIEWIHHRPPRACHETEIRVAERLNGLADSPHLWPFFGATKPIQAARGRAARRGRRAVG